MLPSESNLCKFDSLLSPKKTESLLFKVDFFGSLANSFPSASLMVNKSVVATVLREVIESRKVPFVAKVFLQDFLVFGLESFNNWSVEAARMASCNKINKANPPPKPAPNPIAKAWLDFFWVEAPPAAAEDDGVAVSKAVGIAVEAVTEVVEAVEEEVVVEYWKKSPLVALDEMNEETANKESMLWILNSKTTELVYWSWIVTVKSLALSWLNPTGTVPTKV
ncbi:hypothetical protein WICPIJ_006586 [Wickerhamomyces pijperi]|uniref:Uncharacterized protein n=1 Tax=Wickerhamomyces pijperi TaxID=599730 RepID=A0A9P8TKU5_WICPI|nr:hypothetical protein WICPIJ_006586 [Wickerhamomyces pijperi]